MPAGQEDVQYFEQLVAQRARQISRDHNDALIAQMCTFVSEEPNWQTNAPPESVVGNIRRARESIQQTVYQQANNTPEQAFSRMDHAVLLYNLGVDINMAREALGLPPIVNEREATDEDLLKILESRLTSAGWKFDLTLDELAPEARQYLGGPQFCVIFINGAEYHGTYKSIVDIFLGPNTNRVV